MKFSFLKKIVLFLLTAAIVLCGSGCYVRSDAERFDEYTTEVFRQMLARDTLSLNYFLKNPENYGVSVENISFGNVLPDKALEEAGVTWTESIDSQLKTMDLLFDYEKLTESQQLIYDQLVYYLEASRKYAGLEYYDEYCLGSGSVVTNLPLMLAEFSFREKEDIETYLTLLDTYDTYFSEIMQYEKKKSEMGLFMSDKSLDGFQKNCKSFLNSGEENVLLTSFQERIDSFEGLSQEEEKAYIARNKEIVQTVVMPAYKSLSEELEALRGTGENEGGICNLPKGKQYYEYLIARTVGSDKTVEEMYTQLGENMAVYQQKMLELLKTNPTLEEQMTAFSFHLSDPNEILEYLKVATKEDYPEIPTVNYTIKSIPQVLNNTSVVAFYIISPIDDMNNHTIYMNDSKQFPAADVFTTLAHEGYPGHMYQTVYFSNTNPSPIGYALRMTGYQEGWASYVEQEIYHYCGIEDENLVLALQLNHAYNLLFYAYLDIAVNYRGLDFPGFYTMLKPMGIDEEAAAGVYQALAEDPGAYLPYAIGFLEMTELRSLAEETLGDEFELKEFHKTILELGTVPFSLLEKHVNTWLEEKTCTHLSEEK